MGRIVAIGALAAAGAGLFLACTTGDDSAPPETPFDASIAVEDGSRPLRDSSGAVDTSTPDATHVADAADAIAPTDASDATVPVDSSAPDAGAGVDAAVDAGADADVDAAPDAAADASDASVVCGSGAASGAAAWWAAEGNANDSAGTYDGTVAGGVTFGAGPAGLGQAFVFDGTSAYVAVPDGIIPSTTRAFSIAAWFDPTALPSSQGMIVYGGSNGGEYLLGIESDGTIDCGVKLASDQSWHVGNRSQPVALGQWHLAICVDDGASLATWVDGVAVTPVAIPDSDLYVSPGFASTIGAYAQLAYPSNAQMFTGLIDDVRLYRRALAASEIAAYPQGCTLPAVDAGAPDAGCTVTSLHFGGATDSVAIADSPSLAFGGSGTIEAWVLPEASQGTSPVIFDKWVSGKEDKLLRMKTSLEPSALLFPSTEVQSSAAMTAAAWTHLAHVWDANGQRLYVNGTSVATGPAVTPGNSNGAAYIGFIPRDFTAVPMYGFVSELRISSVARYTASFTPAAHLTSDASTSALWKLDEGSGTTAADASGHGNTGTITGAAWQQAACR